MTNSLLLKYTASDTGARPLPPNTDFWVSPAVTLATADGNYTVGAATTIDVAVSIVQPAAFEIINVQVWVCDPTTVAGPSTALPPFQGATAQQLALSGFYAPPDPTQPLTSVPVIQVTGFLPYPGISALPGGHCCLIANCYGVQADGQEGADLNSVQAANLPNLVQTDGHVGQHNIFADPTPPGMHKISFPFRAATPLHVGMETVSLHISQVAAKTLPLANQVSALGRTRFAHLPLQLSELAVKSVALGGITKVAAQVSEASLQLHALRAQTLTAEIELDPAERPGAVHAFDVIQRGANGHVQGGFRLLTVVER